MARIRKTDTKPEMLVQRMLHGLGYRYRLHRRDLPGNPDIVFASRKKLMFVHECFWHQHDRRLGAKQPRARPEYWLPKLQQNKKRDACNLAWHEALETFRTSSAPCGLAAPASNATEQPIDTSTAAGASSTCWASSPSSRRTCAESPSLRESPS
jgi:DNA mismatch endonuclease Vsr